MFNTPSNFTSQSGNNASTPQDLLSSVTVLIVDDSEVDRAAYSRYLQRDPDCSYQLAEAETLAEGLELWRSQSPDIVLMDMNLPDGRGLEFLTAIRTGDLEKKLPVVMLTGQGDERDAVHAMKLGAMDYLVKGDITAVSLFACLNQVRDRIILDRQLSRFQQQEAVIAESQLGQESCFTVVLPYQSSLSDTPASELTSTSPLPMPESTDSAIAPLILLAEDNESNIIGLSTYLQACNYRVILAKNGEEAVAMAQAHQPDVILMDIQMPKVDGLEAIRLLRSEERFAKTPIVAITALAMPGDQERCLEAGANQYLSKPVGLKQLIVVIQQLLDS